MTFDNITNTRENQFDPGVQEQEESSHDHLPMASDHHAIMLNDERNSMPAWPTTTPAVKFSGGPHHQNLGATIVSSSQPQASIFG